MTDKIILSADSTCDLGDQLKARYDVHYYPFHIILEEKDYQDNVDITVKEIFDRYYSVENMKKYSGLGLTIAKQLVEINGGIITAKYIKNELYIEILF